MQLLNENSTSDFDIRSLLGFLGSSLLMLGAFFPLVKIPVVGHINYFQSGRGDGVFVVILAILSLVLVLLRTYRLLWLTGLPSAGILIYFALNFSFRKYQTLKSTQDELSDNPFRGIGELAVHAVQLEWGWAVMFLGSIMLIASASIDLVLKGKLLARELFVQVLNELMAEANVLWRSHRKAIIALAVLATVGIATTAGYFSYKIRKNESEQLRAQKAEDKIQNTRRLQEQGRTKLQSEQEKAQRIERLRREEEEMARLEAEQVRYQVFMREQDQEEARLQEELHAAEAAEKAAARARLIEERERQRRDLALEKKLQAAEAERIKQEHLQRMKAWYDEFYTPGMGPFKQALARFHKSYRAEDSSMGLKDACKGLKLQAVSARRDKGLMDSPNREVNVSLHEMLVAFGGMAVDCTNGRIADMRIKLESGGKAINRLAQALDLYALRP